MKVVLIYCSIVYYVVNLDIKRTVLVDTRTDLEKLTKFVMLYCYLIKPLCSLISYL